MGHYHDHYLKKDVLLLAVFQKCTDAWCMASILTLLKKIDA